MSQLPAHLQRFQTRDVGATLSANLGAAMPPHISIEGGRFTLIDASNNELAGAWFDQKLGVYVDVCIIDANEHMSRTYYAGAYSKDNEGVRPDCFSDNGTAPSISASSPQANSCMQDPTGVHGCKWSVWGSKINQNGKGVPACSERQKLAVLVPGFDTLFLLAVPPKSGSHLRAYTELCKGNGIKIADVLTRIYFLAGAVGELQFQGVNYIDEPTAVLRQAAWDEKKTDTLVGRNDIPRPAMAAPVQQAIAAPAEQQVQQPGLFGAQQPQAAVFATTAAPTGQPTAHAAPAAGATSPSKGAPTQRRRRRTAAEMQAAQGQPATGQAPQQAAVAPQAPFPVQGQQAAQAAQPATFGIGQAAQASPELANMLDNFFAKQG